MPRSTHEWVESFAIFEKYQSGVDGSSSLKTGIGGAIVGGPSPADVSPEDDKRLRELDWMDANCGTRYQTWS